MNDQNPPGAFATDTTDATMAEKPIEAARVVLPVWFICSEDKEMNRERIVQCVFESVRLCWSLAATTATGASGGINLQELVYKR